MLYKGVHKTAYIIILVTKNLKPYKVYFSLQSVLLKKKKTKQKKKNQINKQITFFPLGKEAPVQHKRDAFASFPLDITSFSLPLGTQNI